MTKQLTILEGPDGAGKSTMAAQLCAEAAEPTFAFHHGPGFEEECLAEAYLPALAYALLGEGHVVMDRAWLSDHLYAPHTHPTEPQGRLTPAQRRQLERIALTLPTVLAVALPPFAVCCEAFASREELLTHEDQLRVVWEGYCDLLHGKGAVHSELSTVHVDYTQLRGRADIWLRLASARPTFRASDTVELTGDLQTAYTRGGPPVLVVVDAEIYKDGFDRVSAYMHRFGSSRPEKLRRLLNALGVTNLRPGTLPYARAAALALRGVPERGLLWLAADDTSTPAQMIAAGCPRAIVAQGVKAGELMRQFQRYAFAGLPQYCSARTEDAEELAAAVQYFSRTTNNKQR